MILPDTLCTGWWEMYHPTDTSLEVTEYRPLPWLQSLPMAVVLKVFGACLDLKHKKNRRVPNSTEPETRDEERDTDTAVV